LGYGAKGAAGSHRRRAPDLTLWAQFLRPWIEVQLGVGSRIEHKTLATASRTGGIAVGAPMGMIGTFVCQASAWFWGFCPVDGERTRLITRVRTRYNWLSLWTLFNLLLDIGDNVMIIGASLASSSGQKLSPSSSRDD